MGRSSPPPASVITQYLQEEQHFNTATAAQLMGLELIASWGKIQQENKHFSMQSEE